MYRDFLPRVQSKPKVITTSGVGTQTVPADMAVISLNVVTESKDPYEAIKENRKMVQIGVDYLGRYGVREEDIFHSNQSLTPVYNDQGEIVSYQSVSPFKVLFYDMDAISEFLYNLKGRHIVIKDIKYTLRNPRQYYDEAIEEAVSDAYTKARRIADQMEVVIDSTPFDLTETSEMDKVIDPSTISEGLTNITATVEAKFQVVE